MVKVPSELRFAGVAVITSTLLLWRLPDAFAGNLPDGGESACDSGTPCKVARASPPVISVPIDDGSALEVPPPTINVPGNSVGRPTDVPDMDIVELSQVLVYTASRRLTSVELAPSVVTVITADDIARRGYKTLYEALGDVPGFQELGVAAWGLLSNRGLVADNNVSYLFLVDGHSMANIVFRGYYEEYRFPLLAKVERIEVVRGPGATLWGSDASMGVINIVTKDGSSMDDGSSGAGKILADYDHEFRLKRDIVNLAYGKRFGHERDLYMAFNASNSNAPWTDGRIAGLPGRTDFNNRPGCGSG